MLTVVLTPFVLAESSTLSACLVDISGDTTTIDGVETGALPAFIKATRAYTRAHDPKSLRNRQ